MFTAPSPTNTAPWRPDETSWSSPYRSGDKSSTAVKAMRGRKKIIVRTPCGYGDGHVVALVLLVLNVACMVFMLFVAPDLSASGGKADSPTGEFLACAAVVVGCASFTTLAAGLFNPCDAARVRDWTLSLSLGGTLLTGVVATSAAVAQWWQAFDVFYGLVVCAAASNLVFCVHILRAGHAEGKLFEVPTRREVDV